MASDEKKRRKLFHTRRIECAGYEREDGLLEIEAQLVDTKTLGIHTPGIEKWIPAGEPIHDMCIKLILDQDLRVHDITAKMNNSPYPSCPQTEARFERLKGSRIAAGWSARVREALGGINGCTHLRDLLQQAATTAQQTLFRSPKSARSQVLQDAVVNSCFSWQRNGAVVRALFAEEEKAK